MAVVQVDAVVVAEVQASYRSFALQEARPWSEEGIDAVRANIFVNNP